MSGPTDVPSIDFILEALPAAEGILVAVGLPELTIYAAALAAALEAVKAELANRGPDLAAEVKAADAAALAELAAKFRKL